MATAARHSRMQSSHEYVRERADMKGRAAAANGKPYSANPYSRISQKELHLAWSEGHNAQRAMAAARRDQGLFG